MKISNTSILNENYEIQHDMDIWIRDGKIVKIQKHSNSLAEEGEVLRSLRRTRKAFHAGAY